MAFLKRSKDPFTQIQNCLQKRDYKGALVWFKPLLGKDSKNTQVRLRYADTLVLAGSKKEAIKQYRVVADELAEAGFMIRAIAISKKIVQLDPSQSDVHQKLAALNEERSRSTSARSALPLQMAPSAPSEPAVGEQGVGGIGVEEVGIEDIGMEEIGGDEIGVEEIGVEEIGIEAPPASVDAGPPELEETPDVREPTLSLDESMAMEFGGTMPQQTEAVPPEPHQDGAAVEVDLGGVGEEPEGAPEEPAPAGFELTVEEESGLAFEEPAEEPEIESVEFDLTADEEAPVLEEEAPSSFDAADEALSFDEEPSIPAEGQEVAAEPEEELEVAVEEEPIAVDEAGLEMEPPAEEPEEELELESEEELELEPEPEEELELEPEGEEEPEPEFQLVSEADEMEMDIETEPDMAADGKDALVGLLGEDIDSMIDSIIDDVGSSVSGTQTPPQKAATRIPLFSDLTAAEFVDVAIMLVRRSKRVGTVIVREGDPGDSMFIISTGEVEATREQEGETVKLATFRDGDFFGEMAVLSGEPRTATVTAVRNTELLELSRSDLNVICSRYPEVEAKLRLAYDERSMQNR